MKFLLTVTLLFLSLSFSAYSEDFKIDAKYKPAEVKETEVYENEKMTLYSIKEDKVQYYVAKPNHPAYPYMIKSKVLGRGVDSRFKATGYGTESDSAKAFLKEIEDINAEKMRKLQEMK